MQLTNKDAQEFLRQFSSLFTKDYMINVKIKRIKSYGDLLHIMVSRPNNFGVGEEHVSADFVLKMIKNPIELETYAKRWIEGFKSPKTSI